ncbi:MAG: hypothetical protein Q7S47_00635, partial [bacterium]|nr:hypothetical protein [bacterium]
QHLKPSCRLSRLPRSHPWYFEIYIFPYIREYASERDTLSSIWGAVHSLDGARPRITGDDLQDFIDSLADWKERRSQRILEERRQILDQMIKMKTDSDWLKVAYLAPSGYMEVTSPHVNLHGQIKKVSLDRKSDIVTIERAWVVTRPTNSMGVPTGSWGDVDSSPAPIRFLNNTVAFQTEMTPEKGARIIFGDHNLIYFDEPSPHFLVTRKLYRRRCRGSMSSVLRLGWSGLFENRMHCFSNALASLRETT